MALKTADVKKAIDTDLETITLQRILDAAIKSVDRAAGKTSAATEHKDAKGSEWLFVDRRSTAITSITERRRHTSDPVVLSADDWRKVTDHRFLRLRDGTNPARFWGSEVTIVYTPELDQDVRDQAAIELCMIDIKFNAYDEEQSGDWKGKSDWRKQRAAVLKKVREGRSPFV